MEHVVGVLISSLLSALIWCSLYSKAGYRWWIGLLGLIPGATVVLFLFFLFANWPVVAPLEEFKVCTGKGTEKSVVAFLMRAERAAKKGQAGIAEEMCRVVADKYAGSPWAQDAELVLAKVRA